MQAGVPVSEEKPDVPINDWNWLDEAYTCVCLFEYRNGTIAWTSENLNKKN